MAIKYQFRYTPLVGKLPGASMVQQTEQAINEIASIVNDNVAQAEIINTLAEDANNNASLALDRANQALETSGRVYVTVDTATDLNTYYDSNLVYISNVASGNLPIQSKGFLEVKTNEEKTACEQLFVADTTNVAYYRHGTITAQNVGDTVNYVVSWSEWSSAVELIQDALNRYVTVDTAQTITGEKTFTNLIKVERNNGALLIKAPDLIKGTEPAYERNFSVRMCEGAGTSTANAVGSFIAGARTNGSSFAGIYAYKPELGSSANASITINYNLDGSVYTSAPTPTTSNSSTQIATTQYVKNNLISYFPLDGSSAITGNVNLSGYVNVGYTVHDSGQGGYVGSTTTGLRIASEAFGVNSAGAFIDLDGRSSSSSGNVTIVANNANGYKQLRLTPDGLFRYDGKDVEVVSAKSVGASGYIRLKSGVQIVWGQVGSVSGGKTVTFPVAFSNTPGISFSSSIAGVPNITAINGTSFTATASNTGYLRYVAVGPWA